MDTSEVSPLSAGRLSELAGESVIPGKTSFGAWARHICIGLLRHFIPDRLTALARGLDNSSRRSHASLFGLRRPDFQAFEISTQLTSIPFGSDGETFSAWVLRPPGNEPRPTVLMRTPYGKDGLKRSGKTFAERGYVVVLVDCRGRSESGGSFFPIQNEVADAEAIIEWIMNQDWYNGRIGVHGVSYNGFCAFAALGGKHADKITCIGSMVSSSRLFPIIYDASGAMNWELAIRWLWLVIGRMVPGKGIGWRLQTAYHFFMRKNSPILEKACMHVPASEIDTVYVGRELEIWQEGLKNPTVDQPFWRGKDRLCTLSGLEGPCPPIHIFTGWSDFFLPGALSDYGEAVSSGADAKLTLGDYSHWDILKLMKQIVPGISDWYDVKMGCAAERNEKRVRCQLQGSSKWIEMDSFPPPSTPRTYYLEASGRLSRVGLAARAGGIDSRLAYTYDPCNPTPAIGGASFHFRNCGRMDQRALERRSDVLVFTTEVATDPGTVIVGKPRVTLYVTTDIEHFDLVARLCVVQRGKSFNVCDGMSRQGTYGGRTYSSSSVDSDGVQRVEFELGPCGLELGPHERLRLQICSGAHPRWLRNFGTGEDPYSAVRTQPCQVQILASAEYPSRVDLPVVS
eukprot:TRINITY_DN19292_c0_g2_i1.p1 TRINITY_DN19292_c0_g2~~TRINITY_DN19292_c0_g2_i1.p1  ORF type:complete len:644 (-),score=35.10 TRINITY_DN19292_c0_g2_i1:238-2115(-)